MVSPRHPTFLKFPKHPVQGKATRKHNCDASSQRAILAVNTDQQSVNLNDNTIAKQCVNPERRLQLFNRTQHHLVTLHRGTQEVWFRPIGRKTENSHSWNVTCHVFLWNFHPIVALFNNLSKQKRQTCVYFRTVLAIVICVLWIN